MSTIHGKKFALSYTAALIDRETAIILCFVHELEKTVILEEHKIYLFFL